MRGNGTRLRLTEDLFVRHAQAIEGVLCRAVHAALLQHKRAGNPVAAWRNGKVVLVPPEEIPVQEIRRTSRSAKN